MPPNIRRRRLRPTAPRPVTTLVTTAALVATALVGAGTTSLLRTSEPDGTPVDAELTTAAFDSGATVVVDDPAIATQGADGGPKAVKEFTRDQEFSMFALTWTGDRDVAAFFRGQRPDGTWTPWFDAESLTETSSTAGNGTNGTELIYIEPTKKVQVSATGLDMVTPEESAAPAAPAAPAPADPAPAAPAPAATSPEQPQPSAASESSTPTPDPADQELHIIPAPERTTTPATPDAQLKYDDIKPVADSAADVQAVFVDGKDQPTSGTDIELTADDSRGLPKVVTRAGWGADESLRCQNPTIDDHLAAITIHHTAGSNNYTKAQSPSIMRGIYKYHAQTLGWCDIGYNALVDKWGTIYEGRAGGLNKNIQGAHAGGFNQNTWGISMMGDYSTVTPSDATINAVGRLAGWRAYVGGFDPTGTDTHFSEGTHYSKYAQGTKVQLPNIFAHRDVGTTTCPGDSGYAQMDRIRTIASTTYRDLKAGRVSDSPTTTNQAVHGDSKQIITPEHKTNPAGAPVNTAPAAPGNPDIAGLLGAVTGSSDGGAPTNTQLLQSAGTLAALALAAAINSGQHPELANLGNKQIINGLKLSDLPGLLGPVVTLLGNDKISQTYKTVTDTFGPVLGNARGGAVTASRISDQRNSEVTYAPFDHGVIVSSPEAGTHALWGAIGDAWASQGFDSGVLGMPLGEEYHHGNLIRVDFQGGYITYNPATMAVEIH